jgi:hypothetical protein
MNQYMLVMRGSHEAFGGMGEADRKLLMEKYYAYVQRLKDEGRFKGGAALSDKSRVLKATTTVAPADKAGRPKVVATDGPFAEAREALNGYFMIEAASLEEAERIGHDCPCLTHGETLEIIEVTRH